jgi:hypothetical protein
MITLELVEKGMSLVHADTQHDLTLSFRCQLFSSFDEMMGGIGRRRRTKLATLAVEKVLPLWDSLFPADRTPQQALGLVEMVIAETISTQIVEKEMGRLWTRCDDLAWRHADKQYAVMVGYGAIQAVRESLSDRHFGCDEVSDESTDMDCDPYDCDSAFCAAVAYAGGAPWEEHSDPQKRLEFWTWWLTSAVRTAVTVE